MKREWKSEKEARQDILNMVADYYYAYKENKNVYRKGERISYAGRIYDDKEMCRLTESALDFWLTSGKFVREFF